MIYLIIIPLLVIIAIQQAKLSLWKMEQDLEDWISFGTGDDIVRCKDQRKEYQYYVKICQNDDLKKLNIPANVVKLIRADLRSKDFKLVYFYLLWLKLRWVKI